MDTVLRNWLEKNDINYTSHSHVPVFTVEEAREHTYHIPGLHCKNLFLKDSKKNLKIYHLVTLPHYKRVELKVLKPLVGAKKLTFASADELFQILKLSPGSVSPFGLVNDVENAVIFSIDREVWNAKKVCCHPNTNDETMELSQGDFQRAVKAFENRYQIIL